MGTVGPEPADTHRSDTPTPQFAPSPTRPRCEFVPADARRLPFDDCSFDVYTIAFGIRNVAEIEAALGEINRVLRPGGVSIISWYLIDDEARAESPTSSHTHLR